jgi:hypothetical protein
MIQFQMKFLLDFDSNSARRSLPGSCTHATWPVCSRAPGLECESAQSRARPAACFLGSSSLSAPGRQPPATILIDERPNTPLARREFRVFRLELAAADRIPSGLNALDPGKVRGQPASGAALHRSSRDAAGEDARQPVAGGAAPARQHPDRTALPLPPGL